MTTNDATRTALVGRLAKRIDTFCEHVGYGDPDVTREEAESYVTEVEEALLADRAVTVPTEQPEYDTAYAKGYQDGQADAGDDLDAMLNSVHPRALLTGMLLSRGGFDARVEYPASESAPDNIVEWGQALGTGPTRIDAIADAVRQAKGTKGGE